MLSISRLFIICLFFLIGGCNTLNTSAYKSSHQADCDAIFNAAVKQEKSLLQKQLVGLSMEGVIAKLGKPNPKLIIHGAEFPIDNNCIGINCEKRVSTEMWRYLYSGKKISSCEGVYAYFVRIYFEDNKVIAVR